MLPIRNLMSGKDRLFLIARRCPLVYLIGKGEFFDIDLKAHFRFTIFSRREV